MPRLLITTPIFYPTAPPHLGHAFTAVVADCLKRFYCLLGYKSKFVTGTDEHGNKIWNCGGKTHEGVQAILKKNNQLFKQLWEELGVEYDVFTQTSSSQHKTNVTQIMARLKTLVWKGENIIYKSIWTGLYCNECERGGDCNLHKTIQKNESSYFLKVSLFKEWILNFYQENPTFLNNKFQSEMINSFINSLEDLSISRSNLEWGITLPWDTQHVLYVWIDALLSYHTHKQEMEAQDKVIHLLGKEIVRFHAIYLPILEHLLQIHNHGTLLVHHWLLLDDQKMSKSLGNVINPRDLMKVMGRDGLRFFLAHLQTTHDIVFKHEEMLRCYNTYLSNNLGNLLSRFGGLIKKFKITHTHSTFKHKSVDELNNKLNNYMNNFQIQIEKNNLWELIDSSFVHLSEWNKLIEDIKPWSLQPKAEQLNIFITCLFRVISFFVWSLSPILIDTFKKLREPLGLDVGVSLNYFQCEKNFLNKKIWAFDQIIFPRIEGV